jgi:hypothetical protein
MNDTRASDAIAGAVRTVLRPLVRLMLARGVTLPLAIELLKRVYVQVAIDESGPGAPATDSRVSLLTGVHRKDVKRLRSLPDAGAELPHSVSLGAQLVSVWTTHPHWLDPARQPRPLPRLASAGGELSFDALVASVSKDIRARPVLDEWLRLGVVRLNERDEVVLNTAAFIPQAGFDEKLSYLSLNVGDHAMAAIENTLGRADPWFERSVHYRGLTPEAIDRLRARAAELGMQSLQALNTEAQGGAGAESPDPLKMRFTFGVYFYAESNDEKKES